MTPTRSGRRYVLLTQPGFGAQDPGEKDHRGSHPNVQDLPVPQSPGDSESPSPARERYVRIGLLGSGDEEEVLRKQQGNSRGHLLVAEHLTSAAASSGAVEQRRTSAVANAGPVTGCRMVSSLYRQAHALGYFW